jgi:CRISPR-associated protein Csm5
MMNTKIKTLTPIHIGSGDEFQGNFEYLYFQQERAAVVIDERKVLGILGEDNIGQWVSCIEKKESLLDLLRQRRRELSPAEVARRTLPVQSAGLDKNKNIKEHLHSGNGSPLLPGSSIKGAMRTVVWAHEIFQNKQLVQSESNLGISRFDRKSGRERFNYSDSALAAKFFGSDPNHDMFRLLMVGDAQFEKTACFKTEVVNLYRDDWKIKEGITQFVEAIPAGESGEMVLQFNKALNKKAGSLFNRDKELLEPSRLFPLINQHTLRLIENEISYWKEDQGSPLVVGTYIEDMKGIKNQIKSCAPNECVLRLGWGTGFRSTTGDWLSTIPEEHYDRLVRTLRPTHDEYITFPKTTRMVEGGTPLGFIKISL